MSHSRIVLPVGLLLAVGLTALLTPSVVADDSADAQARQFIRQYEATVRPLEIAAAKAFWVANVTGKEEDYAKKQDLDRQWNLSLSDPRRFAEVRSIRRRGVADPLLARQIDLLHLQYLGRQVDPELLKKIVAKSTEMERTFNTFRAKVDGRELTKNDVRRVLRESRDSAERRAVWEADKRVGQLVLNDLVELIELRNAAARKLGFSDYHAMQLHLGEQDRDKLFKLFDELDELTREPFARAKAQIDAALAASYGIKPEELQAWHYHDPYFQEAPSIGHSLPEEVYKPLDTIKVCRDFYAGIGLPVDDVLARSDLYEKPGKNSHAFSIDIDRAGDVRILENVVPGREWLSTTLHELGHATYSKHVSCNLPYVLHSDAHPLCTEGIAMMFDRFAQNVDWLAAFGAKVPEPEKFREAAATLRRYQLLIFARYCQAMLRFEAAMYANPRQDLGRLWWDMVEKYQGVKRPEGREEPDFAAKYHFTGAPAYYHNYMLGELFASQVHHALVRELMPGKRPAGVQYVGNRAAGEFLRKRVFEPGMTMRWDSLTRHATGAELSPKAFVEDLGQ